LPKKGGWKNKKSNEKSRGKRSDTKQIQINNQQFAVRGSDEYESE